MYLIKHSYIPVTLLEPVLILSQWTAMPDFKTKIKDLR